MQIVATGSTELGLEKGLELKIFGTVNRLSILSKVVQNGQQKITVKGNTRGGRRINQLEMNTFHLENILSKKDH